MNSSAAALIARLGLIPLPREGGYFRRTWTSTIELAGGRSTGSAILFLLTDTDFSALHRMPTDELWLFHAGDPVEHVQLNSQSRESMISALGADLDAGDLPQLIVRGGTWQGARLARETAGKRRADPAGWALMSCTMSPAWEEREFELGDRAELVRQYPSAVTWIDGLTR